MVNDTLKNGKMVLTAMEFFCDFRFNTGSLMAKKYVEITDEIDQNEYVKLCKKMGGNPQFGPTGAEDEAKGVVTAPMMEME